MLSSHSLVRRERYTPDQADLKRASRVVRLCRRQPAASSRLASPLEAGLLGRVQLPFPG